MSLVGQAHPGALPRSEDRRDAFDVRLGEDPHPGAFDLLPVDDAVLREPGDRLPAALENFGGFSDGDEGGDLLARLRLGHAGEVIGVRPDDRPTGLAHSVNHSSDRLSTCAQMLLHDNFKGTVESSRKPPIEGAPM